MAEKKPPAQQNIAIAGGGWAGLAAAIELCRSGHKVTLFESSPQLGGRARSIEWSGMTLDNGQHLMIGAYQTMLSLLSTLGSALNVDNQPLFKQLPHHLLMFDATTGAEVFELKLPSFPAPLHLLFGILKTPFLSMVEKLQLLIRFKRLLNTPIATDIPVNEWLDSADLPERYRKNILDPVCLAALTTHPERASARAFQAVLQQTFNAPASFTDLLIPTTDLSRLFAEQAKQFILQHGGSIKTRSKLQGLQIENNRVNSINVNNENLHFDQLILATPPRTTARLLQNIEQAAQTCEQINCLRFEPVTTLYLKFSQPVSLPTRMIGMLNGHAEWVFERATSGHANVLAVVISAEGAHLHMPASQLTERILEELKCCIKNLPELLDSQLIIDKRATFQCHVDIDQYRPGTTTSLINLKLAGDYVYIEENNQPGLPSTLEGALRSGVKCAQTIISN